MRRTRTGDFSVKHGSRITTILVEEVDELRRQLDILFPPPAPAEEKPEPDPDDDPATSRLQDMDLEETEQHLVFWSDNMALITHLQMNHGFRLPLIGISREGLEAQHALAHEAALAAKKSPEPSDEDLMSLLRSAIRQVDLNPVMQAAEALSRDAVKRAFEVLQGHTR